MPESIVVDANPIVAALLGGRAREILFSGQLHLHSTQHTLFEVAKYVPFMANKLSLPEIDLFREFQLLPIVACQPKEYEAYEKRAASMIAARDSLDVATLALALSRQLPIWTNDKDFDGLESIKVFTTADLIQRIETQ